MTDIPVSMNRNPVTGKLKSLYQVINSAYQLGAGRYSPSNFDMELVYPRPDSETSQYAYHRIWQTGEPMDIPVRAMWGSFPHCYQILSAPIGWTIGEWLVADGYGDLVVNSAYGTLSNSNPSAGTHNIIVGIWDMTGAFVRATFSIVVGAYGFFAAPAATGTGDGSTAANAMALIDAHVAVDGVSPAKNKILYLRGGDYTWSGDFVISTNKALAVVAYRSEVPNLISGVLGQQFRLKSSDAFVKGLKLTGWGDAAVFRTDQTYYERQSVWRCEIVDAFGKYTIDPPTDPANNEAGWFIDSTTNASKRQNFLFSEITFVNCHEICGFDWYSVKGLIERQVWNTNKATLGEPIWFPKASCEYDMRLLRFDNVVPTSTDNNQGVLMPYNSEILSRAKGHLRYNFVRCNASVSAVVWNGASNSPNDYAADGHDDHNTYIGGKVVSRSYGGDLITYTNDVMQNADGGPLPSSTGYAVSGGSLGTSGIVDSNGRLVNTANRGLYGHQIYGG